MPCARIAMYLWQQVELWFAPKVFRFGEHRRPS